MLISVVIPVYGCREALPELHRRLKDTLTKITPEYEIVLVDDCDKQNSWEEIVQICSIDKFVKGIHLSRNFGQANAITAGVDNCRGDWVVVMDCDLQDRPEAILELYQKAMEGYDVVFARRVNRKDTTMTKFLSRGYYWVKDFLSGTKSDYTIGNFSISRRIVIDNYCKMREHTRAYQRFITWLGFNVTAIDIEGDNRFEGKSSYNFLKKMRLAVVSITSHSNRPLYISVNLGITISAASIIYILYILIRVLTGHHYKMGWPTIIASIYLMGGLILAAIGVLGIYVGNIFNEARKRPLYVIAEMINMEDENATQNSNNRFA